MDVKTLASGRMRRTQFAFFSLFAIASVLFLSVAQKVIQIYLYPSNSNSGLAAFFDVVLVLIVIVSALLAVSLLAANIVFGMRRLHDFDYSGLWVFGLVVISFLSLISITFSIFAIAAQIILLAVPGTRGPNKYGADPRTQKIPNVA